MFCKKCGQKLDDNAKFCPNCGEKVNADNEYDFTINDKDYGTKTTKSNDVSSNFDEVSERRLLFGLFGILLGTFGVEFFYVKQNTKGVLCIMFCWTCIPSIIGFVLGIMALVQSNAEFDKKYPNVI